MYNNEPNYYDALEDSGYPEENISLLIETLYLCQDAPFEQEQIRSNLAALFEEYGLVEYNPDTGELRICTGGWFDNETVIGLLEQTFWWDMCWRTSNRGGEYIFELNER
jgi:hypothetical protein